MVQRKAKSSFGQLNLPIRSNRFQTDNSSSPSQQFPVTCDRFSYYMRRCFSSKELGTLAPPSGSPYATMVILKEQLEESTKRRLQKIKNTPCETDQSDESTSTSSRPLGAGNDSRNRRRDVHNQAIVKELCEVVADLFISESKLIRPIQYGVSDDPSIHAHREQIVKIIHDFVSALPMRYALGAETPSEVLLHMRLMAAARADHAKAAVHIHKLEDERHGWTRPFTAKSFKDKKVLRLVTISCRDAQGLLERITKALASGGSSVLDADVMLSADGIALDRFVVEMSGRLRLDLLSQLIEDFLKERSEDPVEMDHSFQSTIAGELLSKDSGTGTIYFNHTESDSIKSKTQQEICCEIETAVPLTHMLAKTSAEKRFPEIPDLRKLHSTPALSPQGSRLPSVRLSIRPYQEECKEGPDPLFLQNGTIANESAVEPLDDPATEKKASGDIPKRQQRPLVNRRGMPDLGVFESSSRLELQPLDYVTVPSLLSAGSESRAVPLIPFDQLMLIETIGTGRVSTIYRAAWQTPSSIEAQLSSVRMVALKVAMVNTKTADTAHVDELRREADIAARLKHPNICDLIGVAADAECFCLAYEFCEAGSLLSLLSDPRRYYEYLPIAMDIANGMAYLHSRDVIHRDLKPSNILLTKDRRAKISDFGMSVAFVGQELTAETGTYRYMAPEVIRHESYSSNADVYSFGVVLWQLITREVPFASMSPIQAAYAVAEGQRPMIPSSTPRRLQEIIEACWDQESYRRPSFTYIAMALADYAKMAFSPANVGAQTLHIANEMLAHVEGNSTVNVDFTAPFVSSPPSPRNAYGFFYGRSESMSSDVGLEI